MYTFKGGRDLVEEALKMGADVVGGIPTSRQSLARNQSDTLELAEI